MTARGFSLTVTAVKWLMLGLGFNIGQRTIDYAIDSAVGHVTWLAWLGG